MGRPDDLDPMTISLNVTAEEALRLWDQECRAQWPWDTDPTAEVNGVCLQMIASSTHGWLSRVWGETPLRRARPRIDLATRNHLSAAISDLDAAAAMLEGDGQAYFIRLRDIVGWVIERPR